MVLPIVLAAAALVIALAWWYAVQAIQFLFWKLVNVGLVLALTAATMAIFWKMYAGESVSIGDGVGQAWSTVSNVVTVVTNPQQSFTDAAAAAKQNVLEIIGFQ